MPGPGGTPSFARWRSGAHTKHRLQFHLVWTPKYRRRILAGPVAARLRAVLEQTAQENGWNIIALNVQGDHVHLLLQLTPEASVARAMQLLKGGSSFRLRKEFPFLEKVVRRDGLWGEGYFAESVGMVQDETIRRYIIEQPEKDQSLP